MKQPLSRECLVRHHRIVITVPCFNEERWIERTLESVRAQTVGDFAVLVSDNASTDSTARIAEDFAARDPRFHVHRHASNIGGAANFNFARYATDSPFLMWLGAHDCLEPTYLERTLPPLLTEATVSLCYAFSRVIDEADRPVLASAGRSPEFADITGERSLARFPRRPVARYFHALRHAGFCIPINNVIRREALIGSTFQGVFGADRVVLSHIAFAGPFHCVPEYLYLHRTFAARSESYMKRLTGDDRSVADWREFEDLFEQDFSQLVGPNPMKPLYLRALRALVRYHFVPDAPGPLAAFLRRLGRLKRSLGR